VKDDRSEGAQRRRSARVSVSLTVRWMRRSGVAVLQAKDISLHGMFLCTHEVTQPGSLMHLEVVLPNRCTLRMFVIARFVGASVSGHGIGVEIHLMDELERHAWDDYYRSELLPRSRQPAHAGLGEV
jgi:hypothetical protein